jgi:hypothetical protein
MQTAKNTNFDPEFNGGLLKNDTRLFITVFATFPQLPIQMSRETVPFRNLARCIFVSVPV